jgi:hypothetical protein
MGISEQKAEQKQQGAEQNTEHAVFHRDRLKTSS